MTVQKVPVITLKELKATLEKLEKDYQLPGETKIFLNTGWDSVQEIAPDALSVTEVQGFVVADPLTAEEFGGYALLAKAENMQADGAVETAIIIDNAY